MMKILLCFILSCLFGIGNVLADKAKRFEKDYLALVRKHNDKYGGNAVWRSETYDDKFVRRMRGLCKDMLNQADATGVKLSLHVSSCNFCLRDIEITKDICEHSYLEDLVAINLGIIKYALWDTEKVDVHQSREWPGFAIDSAFTFICYPDIIYNNDKDVFLYYSLDWMGHGQLKGPNDLDGLTFDAETGLISSATFTLGNFSGGCHDFYSYLIYNYNNVSLSDIASKCMDTLDSPLMCKDYLLYLVDFSYKSLDADGVAVIEKILGKGDKLYSVDKRFFVNYSFSNIDELFFGRKTMKLFTQGGKYIGDCHPFDICKIFDEDYKQYQFIINRPALYHQDFAKYQSGGEGLALDYLDFGELSSFVLSDIQKIKEYIIKNLEDCMLKRGWQAIEIDLPPEDLSLVYKLDWCDEQLGVDMAERVACIYNSINDSLNKIDSDFLNVEIYSGDMSRQKGFLIDVNMVRMIVRNYAQKALAACKNYNVD